MSNGNGSSHVKRSSSGIHTLRSEDRGRERSNTGSGSGTDKGKGKGKGDPKIAIAFPGASTRVSWTLGGGTVIWKIWPALVVHTGFGTLVTALSLTGVLGVSLAIPNVIVTVLGVIMGFVLTLRVTSGYERYWLGRTYWSDIVRDIRTLSRLIWFHIPLSLGDVMDGEVSQSEVSERVMREKEVALDLLLGFAKALKNYLRGRYGIYFEDLYHLVRPLHEERQTSSHILSSERPNSNHGDPTVIVNLSQQSTDKDPLIPSTRSRGLHRIHELTKGDRDGGVRLVSSSATDEGTPLASSGKHVHERKPFFGQISTSLIPFYDFFTWIYHFFSHPRSPPPSPSSNTSRTSKSKPKPSTSTKHIIPSPSSLTALTSSGIERNVPLEIIRTLSEYFAVLDNRKVVAGGVMGGLMSGLEKMENGLGGLERILTTPLPWAYSVHIRHCIWIYLFLLPFQLLDTCGWYTILGTGVVAFYFLGFLAAAEEIEQPFGYDKNDLDIESFIDLIDSEMTALRLIASPNVIIFDPPFPLAGVYAGNGAVNGAGGNGMGNGGNEGVPRKVKKRSVEEVGKKKVQLQAGVSRGDGRYNGDGGLDGLPDRYGEV